MQETGSRMSERENEADRTRRGRRRSPRRGERGAKGEIELNSTSAEGRLPGCETDEERERESQINQRRGKKASISERGKSGIK